MKASYQGHNEIIELLVAAGANTDLKNQVSLHVYHRLGLLSTCANKSVW